MQYASDGVRLFACGVAAAGVGSTLVEWNESDGAIARRYAGFRNPGQNLARFDSLASRYLIAGDEGIVKVPSRCAPVQGARLQDIARSSLARKCPGLWHGATHKPTIH